jgi:NhaP-type Na+/H+ and K+/H+ antiporter
MINDAHLILVAGALLAAGIGAALVAWAGLRGGVPVVLATLPVLAGVRGSVRFFDLVFFAVLVSTVVQGTTVEWCARRLGVAAEPSASARAPSSGR